MIADEAERALTADLLAAAGTEPRQIPLRPTTGLTRRPRLAKPPAPPLPPDDDSQSGCSGVDGLQLPMIDDGRRRRRRKRDPAGGSSPDRLAALGPRRLGSIALRTTVEWIGDDRLARLSIGSGGGGGSWPPVPRSRLRLESAEGEGRVEREAPPRPATAASWRRSASAPKLADDADSSAGTRYAVLNGRTRTEASDFDAFRRRYSRGGGGWGRVSWMARCMELFLSAYAVPIAFVNGEKLAALANEFDELHPSNRRPTGAQLLDCLINRSDAARLVSQPGRRFSGPQGVVRACALIQARWRGFAQRRRYRELQRRRRAAAVIAVQWLVHLQRRAAQKRLSEARTQHLDGYHRRLRQLAKNWTDWQRHRRVLVHLPSLGFSQRMRQRLGAELLSQLQAGQMSRLCDIRDPNVDLVLVCPLPLSPEVSQYYSRLAGLQPAIRSGRAEDQCDASRRFRLVVPEAVGRFPEHPLCLSALLNYSPKALNEIRDVVQGRRAYIVPGLACADDLAVADKLDLPILCPEPAAVSRFSQSAGVGEILHSAGLPVPPGEAGLPSSVDSLAESLASLISANLDVRRWLVTLEESDDGDKRDRNRRVFETGRLPCHRWALDERRRIGDSWSASWAREGVLLKLLDELKQSDAAGLGSQCGPEFLTEFANRGGCIRALPDGRAVRVDADLCVEPTGAVRLVSCSDAAQLDCADASGPSCVPQSALQPARLSEFCSRLGAACFERRIVGHVSVEFEVLHRDGRSAPPTVWTTGLQLRYSDTAAMTQLLQFATNSSLDPVGQELAMRRRLPGGGGGGGGGRNRPRTAAPAVGSTAGPAHRRFAALSSSLWHSGLSTVDFGVFFQLCKARGVGFDIVDLTGTMFSLVDSARRDRLCVLTVSDGPERARAEFARVLAAINEEVGANAPSNFASFLPPGGRVAEKPGTREADLAGNKDF